MEKPIIEVKNISKRYNITHQRGGYVALRDVLANIIYRPFNFLISKTKEVTGIKTKEQFWALKDINFSVERGEAIGIIGSNGAGKSTLLKILSQITPPTEGEIIMRGTVGSLLEVGTGFHPELTGRENIFLNGAILGMPKKEIAEKFDDIVKFSGIEKFLDTPVKRYSSGMYVRLAFAVAAHMEPDILIVDEVLAVGDAEFQKKCLGKMDEVTHKEGRTILFVSHNLSAISKLCDKVIVLNEGKVVAIKKTEEAIEFYQKQVPAPEENSKQLHINADITATNFLINEKPISSLNPIQSGEEISIECELQNTGEKKTLNIGYGIRRRKDGVIVIFTHAELEGIELTIDEKNKVSMYFEKTRLSPGEYTIEFHAWLEGRLILTEKEIGIISILPCTAFGAEQTFTNFPSVIMTDSKWHVERIFSK